MTMTFDDRRLSRCLHLLSMATAVGAFSLVVPAMVRLMGDDFTVGTSLSMAALFVGLPAMIGLVAWTDRSAPRGPAMSAFLVVCGLLSVWAIVVSLRMVLTGADSGTMPYSFGVFGVSIALAVAAAFVRDRGHGAAIA